MDPITGAAVAAPIIGAGASLIGNRQQARFNAMMASDQRGWATVMRNTQWQAAVEDMRRAGINPALAYSQGPNRGGGGSAGAGVGNPGAEASSSALQIKTALEQYKLMREQRSESRERQTLAKAQARKEAAMATRERTEADLSLAKWQHYFDKDGNAKQPLMDLISQEHGARLANSARSVSEARLTQLAIPERKAMAQLFEHLGAQGKGMQIALPLILQLIRNQGMVAAKGVR